MLRVILHIFLDYVRYSTMSERERTEPLEKAIDQTERARRSMRPRKTASHSVSEPCTPHVCEPRAKVGKNMN